MISGVVEDEMTKDAAEKIIPSNYSVNIEDMLKFDHQKVDDVLSLIFLQKADEVQIKETNNYRYLLICVTNEAGLEKNLLVNTVTVFNMIEAGALKEIKQ